MKRTICFFSVILLVLTTCLFSSCTNNKTEEKKETAYELGEWIAKYKISDMDTSSMSEEERMLLSLLAGNTAFEVNVEFCEDGTFTYEVSTDEVEEALSDSVSKIASFFINFDLSVFTDRLIDLAFEDTLSSEKTEYYGTYKSKDGIITATDDDGEILLFKVTANRLTEIDNNKKNILSFKRNK